MLCNVSRFDFHATMSLIFKITMKRLFVKPECLLTIKITDIQLIKCRVVLLVVIAIHQHYELNNHKDEND